MSASLTWRPPPVDPEPLGTAKHPFLGLMYAALSTEGWAVSESDLREPLLIEADSPVVPFLRGVLTALPVPVRDELPPVGQRATDLELRAEIERFLAHLSTHGSLQIQVVR